MDPTTPMAPSPEIPAAPPVVPVQSSLKKLLIGVGVLELILPAIALYLLRQLSDLQLKLGHSPPLWGKVFFGAVFLFALAQILIGLCDWEAKLGKEKTKILFMAGLVAALVTIPATIMFVIMPIYQLTANF